jgi:hypothetical protein
MGLYLESPIATYVAPTRAKKPSFFARGKRLSSHSARAAAL